MAVVDKHAPLRKMFVKGDSAPWYNAELGELRKKRDKFKKEGKLIEYRSIRNMYNNKIRSTQSRYYKQQMQKVSNGEKVWDIFNEITQFRHKRLANIKKLVTQDGTVISEFSSIADELASEFVFKNVESINDDFIREINEYEQNYKNVNPEYVIPTITPVELQKAIGKVKKCKNLPNTIPKRIFKTFSNAICIPLCVLFNFILNQNIIPDVMKIATCTPLYKGKGRFSSSGSSRAIFHHSFVTKIFEKILFFRLTSLVDNKLSNAQHGFRQGRSCKTAVALFSQKLYDCLDMRSGKAVAVFIDFRKAFDTVNRKILLRKLMNEFNLPPYMVKILTNYFMGRKFKICMGERESKYYNIENGVPPGAGPSALLFSLFINNLSEITDLDTLLYADDAVFFTKCESFSEGILKINESMIKLELWCKDHDIKINVEKTKFMCFFKGNDYRSKRQLTELTENVIIYGKAVERVDTFKYLGVHFDSALTFKKHFSQVEKRMNSALGRLYAHKRCIPKSKQKTFLSAFVTSIFEYCNIVWAIQSDAELGKIQNRINRYLFTLEFPNYKKRNRNFSKSIPLLKVNQLLNEMKLLTIMELRKLELVKFIYKFENNVMFKDWFERMKLSTKDKPRLKVPVCKTEKFKNSVRWNSTLMWNEIVNAKVRIFDDDDEKLNYVDNVKKYLCEFRSKLYV